MGIQIIQSSEEIWDVMTGDGQVHLGLIWKRGTRLFNRPPYEYQYRTDIGSGRGDGRLKFGNVYPTFEEAEAAIKELYKAIAYSILSEK